MAVNDVLQVTFVCARSPQVGLNVRHYLVSAEVTGGATLLEIGTVLKDAFSPLYQEVLSSSASFQGVMVQKIRPLPMGAAVPVSAGPVAGLRTGDPLPMQVSGIITLRTDFAGRGNRGRMYVPFPGETSNDGDQIPTGTYLEDLDAIGAEVMDTQVVVGASGTTTIVPIIFRRLSGNTVPITGRRANQRWATQRRRGLYGAPNIPAV